MALAYDGDMLTNKPESVIGFTWCISMCRAGVVVPKCPFKFHPNLAKMFCWEIKHGTPLLLVWLRNGQIYPSVLCHWLAFSNNCPVRWSWMIWINWPQKYTRNWLYLIATDRKKIVTHTSWIEISFAKHFSCAYQRLYTSERACPHKCN